MRKVREVLRLKHACGASDRLIAQSLGIGRTTVGEYLRRKRIEHACHLVSNTNMALAEIAMTCGFSDQSHFSATFRRQVGLTPARFRQMSQTR